MDESELLSVCLGRDNKMDPPYSETNPPRIVILTVPFYVVTASMTGLDR